MLFFSMQSAVALLRNPDPSLLPPSLESRREQAAIRFICKLLEGQGRGMARTLTPEFDDPSAPKPRRSAPLAAARQQHLYQLRPVHLQPNSLATVFFFFVYVCTMQCAPLTS